MTKAELEQRLTAKQSECIEWAMRCDALDRENAELRDRVAYLEGRIEGRDAALVAGVW